MSQLNTQHPSPDSLAGYRAGRLFPQEAEAIAQHLSACPQCRRLLQSADQDTFPPNASNREVTVKGRAPGDQDSAPQNPAEAATVGFTSAPAASSEDVPAALTDHPRYRVLQLLGTGGMGSVYKAEHRKMERMVALKVLNPELIRNAAALQRFLQEVKTAARLLHPNIVTAYDADEAGGVHFLVMEYVEGVSLADLVKKRGRMPVARACECIRQAALGLQHAFEKGMVHRDIKPQNLMLSAQGRVKILDFGLARFAMESVTAAAEVPANSNQKTGLTQAGTIMGTPDYMAPEQAADARQADIRADIYSLGCTLYDLLTGQPPFPEGTIIQKVMAHHERKPRPLADFRADVPRELTDVLARMLAKSPAERQQTPVEVAKALVPFVKPGAVPEKDALPKVDKTADAGDSVRGRSAKTTLPVASASVEKELIAIANEESRKPRPAKSRRVSRTREEPWYLKKPVWLTGAAALAVLVVLGIIVLARNSTPLPLPPPAKATLTVQADGADAAVLVMQDGKQMGRIDPKQVPSVELESGRYHLELEGAPEGISLSRKTATLLPGDAVIVKVQRTQSSADAAGKLAKETKPSAEPERPTGPGQAAKFVPLFNGENLNGWEKVGKGDWTVENGVLRAQGAESPGWLATERIYADFELTLEYRLGPKGNSGVFVHAWKEGNPNGGQFLEIQLIDDQASNTVGKDTGTAAIFGVVAPRPAVQSVPNSWHKLSIRAEGRRLQVSFDGRQVIDYNLDDYPGSFQRFPGLKMTSGRIGLQHFGTPVEFRNIQIKELSASAQLLIESEEPSASVVVKRDGKIVAGPTTERRISLSPGDYTLDWPEPQPLLQFSTPTFELPPGSQKIVKIRRVHLAWPGVTAAPDLSGSKPIFDDDFSNPKSGFGEKKQQVDKTLTMTVAYGRNHYSIDFRRRGAGLSIHNYYVSVPVKPVKSFACQVIGRVTGSPTAVWALQLGNEQQRRGIDIAVGSKSQMAVWRTNFQFEPQKRPLVGPLQAPLPKSGNQFNTLLIVVRGRLLEVYVNSWAACDPISLDQDYTPADLFLATEGSGAALRAEFQRVTVWPADKVPSPLARGAVPK